MKIAQIGLVVILGFSVSGCSSVFKNSNVGSSWDCPNAQGVGCSSIEYADEIARQKLVLNEANLKKPKSKKKKKHKILVNKHERDFEIQTIQERETK